MGELVGPHRMTGELVGPRHHLVTDTEKHRHGGWGSIPHSHLHNNQTHKENTMTKDRMKFLMIGTVLGMIGLDIVRSVL